MTGNRKGEVGRRTRLIEAAGGAMLAGSLSVSAKRRMPDPVIPGTIGAPDAPASAIADVARIRALLIAAARRGEAMSYSELLVDLGHRFTRPKMRAVCRTLDAIDRLAADAGEPELAVLVVRESDGLPGQGWWVDEGRALREGYEGPWVGPRAKAFVDGLQERAFAFWRDPKTKPPRPKGTRRKKAEGRSGPATAQ